MEDVNLRRRNFLSLFELVLNIVLKSSTPLTFVNTELSQVERGYIKRNIDDLKESNFIFIFNDTLTQIFRCFNARDASWVSEWSGR